MGKTESRDKLTDLKLLDHLKEYYTGRTITVKEITDDARLPSATSEKISRTYLDKLFKGGYIEGNKNPKKNNQWEYNLPVLQEEGVNEDSVIQYLFSDLMGVLTQFIDTKPAELSEVHRILNKHSDLSSFLSVSRENEFPHLYDSDFVRVNKLAQHYRAERFTKLSMAKDADPVSLYVFQVRFLSNGFQLVGLKQNKNGGASIVWIPLIDVIRAERGKSISLTDEQKEFIKKELATLSNQELKELAA